MNKKENIRVLIIDDHESLVDTFRMLTGLPRFSFVEVAKTASTTEEALVALENEVVDVVVIDMLYQVQGVVDYEWGQGIIATAISKMQDPPKFLALTVMEKPAYMVRAHQAGASGYLLKSKLAWGEIFDAIRRVHNGELVFPPEYLRYVVRGEDVQGWISLTDREQEVWKLIADGHSDAQIGLELGIKAQTVRGYISGNLYPKLGVSNRSQATRKWLEEQYGVVDVDPK